MKVICRMGFICLFFVVFTGCGTGHDFTEILKATSETDTIEEVADLSNCVEDINRSTYFGTIDITLKEDCLINYIDKQILENDTTETPAAALVSASPASGDLAANGSISVTFDNNPGDVKASAGTVAGSGKSRTIFGPFTPGALALTITWTNGDGSHTLNYTVVAADETAPEVTASSPKDGAEGVDPAKVFEDGIEVTFNEDVSGVLMLMDGDDDVGCISEASDNKITLTGNAGQQLSNETEYEIAGTVRDGAGNEAEVSITFITKGRE